MFVNPKNSKTHNGLFLKYSQAAPSQDFTSSNYKKSSLNYKNDPNKLNLSYGNNSSKDYDFSQNSFEVEMKYRQTPRSHL